MNRSAPARCRGRRTGRRPVRAGLPWERLAGGASRAAGSLLIAMLVMMTISAILLSIATTQWTFIMQREREKELVFRGIQIAKGIEEWPLAAVVLPLLVKAPLLASTRNADTEPS